MRDATCCNLELCKICLVAESGSPWCRNDVVKSSGRTLHREVIIMLVNFVFTHCLFRSKISKCIYTPRYGFTLKSNQEYMYLDEVLQISN